MDSQIIEQVAIYDKDDAALADLKYALRKLKLSFTECKSVDFDNGSLFRYRAIITHIDDKHWPILVNKSPPGTLRLRISNTGRRNDEAPHSSTSGACILSISRESGMMDDKDWKAVLAALLDSATGLPNKANCANLINRKATGEWTRFIANASYSMETLPSLSLRARTYLALCNQEAAAEGLHPSQPQWWRNSLVLPNLATAVEDEREALKLEGDDPRWQNVKTLVQAIQGEHPIESEVVVNAQQALAEIFTSQKKRMA